MNNDDFPTVFSMADKFSINCQKSYLNKIKLNGVIATISAILILLSDKSNYFLVFSILTLLVSIISMWSLVSEKQEKLWYRSRALAESVKSLTWKFVIGGEPFVHNYIDDREITTDFIKKINGVRNEHKEVYCSLVPSDNKLIIISDEMERIRRLTTQERAKYYLEKRVLSQKEWYLSKAKYNGTRAKFWSNIIVAFLFLALFLLFIKILYPEFKYYPIEICLLLSTFSFTWLQTKRFNELNAAYLLTAHEITEIEFELENRIKNIDFTNFSEFVSDCENAFSREHTQWLARRDSLNHV